MTQIKKTIEIAIVEDAKELRDSMEELIQQTPGMECRQVFGDGESAITFLTSNPVDVVLMDIHLPGMSGIECVAKLKAVHSTMQFIMCTIFQDDENVFSAIKSGASGYLLKMDDPEKIINSIIEINEGGSPMNPQIARRVLESFRNPPMFDAAGLLTKRELEILHLLAKGLRYKEIAEKIFISTDTVRKHINNIYQKLHVQSRTEAVNKVFGR